MTKLEEFADHWIWEHLSISPDDEYVGNAVPIGWLRDADRLETTMTEFYEEFFEALLEKYAHP